MTYVRNVARGRWAGPESDRWYESDRDDVWKNQTVSRQKRKRKKVEEAEQQEQDNVK